MEENLDLVFLSRICKQKNLLLAVEALKTIDFSVSFSIYGPIEDGGYWKSCKNKLEDLSNNISWNYKGDVPSDEVQNVLQKHDVFILPTFGENYGHVIFETLSVGCIPIISDKTPWNIIAEKKAGFVIPLSKGPGGFSDALKKLFYMPQEKFLEMSDQCVKIAQEKVKIAKEQTGYRTIFD